MCFRPCGECLAQWDAAIPLDFPVIATSGSVLAASGSGGARVLGLAHGDHLSPKLAGHTFNFGRLASATSGSGDVHVHKADQMTHEKATTSTASGQPAAHGHNTSTGAGDGQKKTSQTTKSTNGLTTEEAKLLYPGLGCGYTNGQELLGYYTMAQTSFVLFFCVMVAMAVCNMFSISF